MSRKEKLILKFQQRPKNFTWDELASLLKYWDIEKLKPVKQGALDVDLYTILL